MGRSLRLSVAADTLPSLPDDAWERLERLLERFEDAWRRGAQPALDPFLQEAQALERPVLLRELVHGDLHYRLQARQPVRVELYLQRYPELARDPAVATELILAEFRV